MCDDDDGGSAPDDDDANDNDGVFVCACVFALGGFADLRVFNNLASMRKYTSMCLYSLDRNVLELKSLANCSERV